LSSSSCPTISTTRSKRAKLAGCYHNTGEGGISPYHKLGADLIYQIGTGYFGCRDLEGKFSMDKLAGLGLDRNALVAALQAQNIVRPAGVIQTGDEALSLRVSGSFRSELDVLDALWRFTEDENAATPYLGVGFSIAGHDECGQDTNCPDLWVNLTFGIELRYRSTFNWLLEYRALDALDKHRLFIGLTTRRGN